MCIRTPFWTLSLNKNWQELWPHGCISAWQAKQEQKKEWIRHNGYYDVTWDWYSHHTYAKNPLSRRTDRRWCKWKRCWNGYNFTEKLRINSSCMFDGTGVQIWSDKLVGQTNLCHLGLVNNPYSPTPSSQLSPIVLQLPTCNAKA